MYNIYELSNWLFVCLGDLSSIYFSAWGQKKIVGLWFAVGINTQADTTTKLILQYQIQKKVIKKNLEKLKNLVIFDPLCENNFLEKLGCVKLLDFTIIYHDPKIRKN